MNLRLIKPSVCPPDGFRYVFPEDGFIAHGWTYDAWVSCAASHVQANNLPHHELLSEQMEEQLCRTLPPGWCSYDDPNAPRVSTSLDWNAVKDGLTTFARWIAKGCKYVSQGEADRRALICSRCYLNVHVDGCAACHAAVQEITKGKHSAHDYALRACAVCKCLLKAKVHFPMDILDRENPKRQELYPEHCWLKKGGPNYVS